MAAVAAVSREAAVAAGLWRTRRRQSVFMVSMHTGGSGGPTHGAVQIRIPYPNFYDSVAGLAPAHTRLQRPWLRRDGASRAVGGWHEGVTGLARG